MTALGITEKVMIGTALLGGTAGVVGSFAVLRRRALVGDMLSHASLPGVCIAFWLLGTRDMALLALGALVSGLIGVGFITLVCRWTRTREDAAITIVLSTFFGAGVVILSWLQSRGLGAGLQTYLFGQTAGMRDRDVLTLSLVALTALLFVALLYKEFKIVSFDLDFAQSQGWPTLLLDWGMMGALAVVTVVGLPIVGVILMAAMLILPGASARFWTERLGVMLILAGLMGAAAGVLGTWLSSPLPHRWLGVDPLAFGNNANLPPGPVIVLSGTALFLVSVLLAPRRGVLARALGELRFRRKMAREHLLRTLYELSENALPQRDWLPVGRVVEYRGWSGAAVAWLLGIARRRGWIERMGPQVRLTETGLRRAAEVTRAHRLWEVYLIERANIAADHVHRDADQLEHLLPAALVARLEQQLESSDQLPPSSLPGSPHALKGRDDPGDPHQSTGANR